MAARTAQLGKSKINGSVTEDVYVHLRAELLTCRILPGVRLKTNEVADRLGVHVGAVREALFRLTSEGLTISIPQRGFAAAPLSVKDLTHLTDARVEIESLCLRRSMQHGDLAWEARIVAATHAVTRTPKRDPVDPALINEDFTKADTEYNEALVAACDNPILLDTRRRLRDQSERYRRLSYLLAMPERIVNHQEITQAVLSRDGDIAASIYARYIKDVAEILLKAMKRLKLKDGFRE
jgi:DNA-binding GntR family transcriptional regulator